MEKVSKALQEFNYIRKKFSNRTAVNYITDKIASRFESNNILKNTVKLFYKKKHKNILEILNSEFIDVISSYKYNMNQSYSNNKVIFSMWLQGLNNAPEIVQATVKSQKRYAEKYGYKYVLLDEENVYNYVDLPEKIREKFSSGKIDRIKFSDIIRVMLLSKYGGVWLDSTIYIDDTKKLDYFENDFYTIKNKKTENMRYIPRERWVLYCIAAKKNNIIVDFLKTMLIEYFSRYDKVIDYFLIDYFMEIGYQSNEIIRNYVDNVTITNNDVYFLANNLEKDYVEKEWENILKTTNIFKCSYKVNVPEVNNNYYSALLGGRLELEQLK